jgi:ABC-type dipeptide/oligopeptide/nickel transport system permease subunit
MKSGDSVARSGVAARLGRGLRLRGKARSVRALDRTGLAAFVIVVLVAMLAPLIAPHDPTAQAGPPLTPPGGSFWLGTDEIGHDILSRIIYGARASLLGAAAVILSGVVIGGLIGLAAGAVGGPLDAVLMRFTDVFLALPAPLLAIAVVAAIGPGYVHTLIAVAVVWWPWYARIVRGEITALRHRPQTEAAILAGVSRRRLWLRHLLPGSVPEVIVLASLDVGGLILMLAGLSFLGLGAPAPAPELGAMSAQGLRFLLSSWWVPVMPAAAIALLAFLSNLVGDAMRDLLGARE